MTELVTFNKEKQIEETKRFGRQEGRESSFVGISMGTFFAHAKKLRLMPLAEIEKLLSSDFYEARIGAVSIMDFQARDKKLSDSERKILFNLYIRKHDCIDNWDMVDRGAPYIVGGYLFD